MDAYATEAQLGEWVGDLVTVPADAARLLVRASALIDGTVRGQYTVDTAGIPTDADIAQALADAVCAQVEQWIEVGEHNDIDGLAGQQTSVSGYSGPRAPRLAPRALDALANAGLVAPGVLATSGGC